jgi:predicted amidophosphoribosyltransferase
MISFIFFLWALVSGAFAAAVSLRNRGPQFVGWISFTCSECGTEVSQEAEYCHDCGANLVSAPVTPS